MSENLSLTRSGRQYPLVAAVRISGADLASAAIVSIPVPPNTLLLRGQIYVITADGGTAPTVNVGISNTAETDPDEHLANGAIGVAGATVPLALKLTAYYPEKTDITVAYGTGTPDNASDLLLILEYGVLERSNEVYD